ncbi:gamma-glutamyl-gamma-aminobutyrate hydrolase family protein, partial [Streptomyces sp. NPDC054808]
MAPGDGRGHARHARPGGRGTGRLNNSAGTPLPHRTTDPLGTGPTAAGHAADGTVEALELPAAPGWVLGVQWHPEMGEDM